MNKKQNQYLSEHFDEIRNKVRRYTFIPPLDYDECISYVLEKLCFKIQEYKTVVKFNQYLNRNIKNFVINYYHRSQQDSVEINENKGHNDLEDKYWISKRDYAIACEINELKTYNRNIILLYYYDELSENEISRIIGVTQQTISNHLKKSLATLKPKIERRLKELDDIKGDLL